MLKKLEDRIKESLPNQSSDEQSKIKKFVLEAIKFNKSHNIFLIIIQSKGFAIKRKSSCPIFYSIFDNSNLPRITSNDLFFGK